ncbi:MAG: YceI family protein [Pseudomonadota bacterium]
MPLALAALLMPAAAHAAPVDYQMDIEGAHAFIQFRIKHLGYSWLHGRFNRFDGRFRYDKDAPENSTVEVTVKTASIDTNHAERDKHLRSDKFLHVKKYPKARFVSTAFQEHGDGTATLAGDLTLHGVTRPITIDVRHIGNGADPWGGYRRGFEGSATLTLADFGMDYDLGPASRTLELTLSVEGIRQKERPKGGYRR